MKRGFLNGKKVKKNPLYPDTTKDVIADKLPNPAQDSEKKSVAEAESIKNEALTPQISVSKIENNEDGAAMPEMYTGKTEGIEDKATTPDASIAETENNKDKATTVGVKTPAGTTESNEVKTPVSPIAKSEDQSTNPSSSAYTLADFLEKGIDPFLKNTSFVTVPPRNQAPGDDGALEDSDPDGHAEVLTYPDSPVPARLTGTQSGYPKPVPKTPQINCIVKEAPGMGQGVFAARDIKAYELVFAERPILVTSHSLGFDGAPLINLPGGENRNRWSDMRAFRAEFQNGWEKQLERAVGRMKEDDRKAFMDLVMPAPPFVRQPCSGRVQVNGIGLMGLREGETPGSPQQVHYSGVAKVASRLNHSCSPNIIQRFSVDSFCLTFTAVRDIKEGEQLFYSYINPYQRKSERWRDLENFRCQCTACQGATPEQEELRKTYNDSIATFYHASFQQFANIAVVERALEGARKFKEMSVKAGMSDTIAIDGIIFSYSEKINDRKGNHADAARCKAERQRLLKISSMTYD